MAVVNDVLPIIDSTLKEAGLPSFPSDIIDKLGFDYVWRAMDLMKVSHNSSRSWPKLYEYNCL